MPQTFAKLSVGAVIRQTFDFLAPATSWTVALLLGGLPQFIAGLLGVYIRRHSADDGGVTFAVGMLGLVAGIVTIVGQGALIQAALQHAKGERPTVAEMFSAGRKVFPRLFVVSLVTGIGLMVGLLLFVVPGVILALRWAVAPVTAVTRGNGYGPALARSVTLTKGDRWRILGLALLFVVAIVVVAIGVEIPVMIFRGNGIVEAVGQGVIGTIQLAIMSSGQAALYLELDRAKGGPGSAAIAETFA